MLGNTYAESTIAIATVATTTTANTNTLYTLHLSDALHLLQEIII